MDYRKLIKDAQEANKGLLNTAKAENRLFTDDEQKTFDENITNISKYQKAIENEESFKVVENDLNVVVDRVPVDVKVTKDEPVFKNFTEQLADIKNFAETGVASEKLKKIQNAASGMSAGVGSDGGFAIQDDFAGMILDSAIKDDPVLSLVDSYEVKGDADRVKWIDIDEDSVATSVFGGIQVYRSAEAAAVSASKPKLKEKELKLEKLMGLAYATYELDTSSNFIDQLYTRGFTTAIRRKLGEEIVSGDGVGRGLGILSGGGLVTVAKESSQTADTINYKNLVKMYHSALNRNEGKWVWLVNPDAHEQFDYLDFPVGTGGVPVYTPASMSGTVDMFRGVPVVSTDHCSAIGDKGDVILADMSDYFLAYKGGIQKDVSIHVSFLTAENAFRFIYMANGRPKTTNTLTIKNSSKARGKYITLAERA